METEYESKRQENGTPKRTSTLVKLAIIKAAKKKVAELKEKELLQKKEEKESLNVGTEQNPFINQVTELKANSDNFPKKTSWITKLAIIRAVKKKEMKLQQEKQKKTYIKSIIKIFGNILWYGSGALLLIFWIIKMTHWMGSWGTVLSIILSPGVAVFPIVFWIVEGVFPVFYFLLWGFGWIGLLIKVVSSD